MVSSEYLAGFFDGEGCIDIATRGSKHKQLYLRLAVSQTNLQVLSDIQEEFGGGIYTIKKRADHHKQAWVLVWTTKTALDVLKRIYPYLKVKRSQAQLVLEEWKPLIRLEHSVGNPLTETDTAKRLEVKQKLSSLKK